MVLADIMMRFIFMSMVCAAALVQANTAEPNASQLSRMSKLEIRYDPAVIMCLFRIAADYYNSPVHPRQPGLTEEEYTALPQLYQQYFTEGVYTTSKYDPMTRHSYTSFLNGYVLNRDIIHENKRVDFYMPRWCRNGQVQRLLDGELLHEREFTALPIELNLYYFPTGIGYTPKRHFLPSEKEHILRQFHF